FFCLIFICLMLFFCGCLGLFFSKLLEYFKNSIMISISLVVIYIGLDMVSEVESIVLLMISLVSGTVIGELLKIDDHLNKCIEWIIRKINIASHDTKVNIAFINATLFFVVGAMSIIGALDSGIRGNHDVLMIKGMM